MRLHTFTDKGEVLVGRKVGKERVAQTGMWRLKSGNKEPENLDGQIDELLGELTDDLDIWRALGSKYRIDLFCGLFLRTENEGLSISSASLAALGQRGIQLVLDIDGPTFECMRMLRFDTRHLAQFDIVDDLIHQGKDPSDCALSMCSDRKPTLFFNPVAQPPRGSVDRRPAAA